jgi:aminobenzoyl-glutamate transport protein
MGEAAVEDARAPRGVLGWIERIGNRLPDPATIFVGFCLLTLVVSWIAARLGVAVPHPVTGKTVTAVDLLSADGLRTVLGGLVTNFTAFAPLGTVLTVMLGIGVAERTGLLAAGLKASLVGVPRWAVTPAVLFAGMTSHVAADAGYVVLIPLAALLYASLGRHPLAGVAAMFAAVAGGYSANLFLGAIDPMLAGMTQEAARLYDPSYTVLATANYYFLASSVVLLIGVGWFISERIVEPRLGPWRPAGEVPVLTPMSPLERRGLIAAGVALLATVAVIALLTLPTGAPLRDPTTGDLKPFWASLVGLLMLLFLAPGIAFGIVTGSLRSDRDAVRMMSEAMATMGPYIVLAFFAGQFVAWFRQSELGLILAIRGADLLQAIHLTGAPLMVGFIVVAATIDLFVASASAKWAVMGPIFVPMLMRLGWSPEVTQALYRVGDSVMNCVTPLNPYFPIVIVAVRRYAPETRLGTLLAAMLPYSIGFGIAWCAFVVLWVLAGLPPGPNAPLHYPPHASGF